jgi:hypothetical protein
VQELILWWMVPRSVIFNVLCRDSRHQRAGKTAAQEKFM